MLGNAADLDVLERAGLREAPTAVLTTRDDDSNMYLAIYCRRGKSIADSSIRPTTGSSIVAVDSEGDMLVNPDPGLVLERDMELVLIGTDEAEDQFLERYAEG